MAAAEDGSIGAPFHCIQRAADVAAERGVKLVVLRGGTYYLDSRKGLGAGTLGPADSGTTIVAYEGEEVVLSGGVLLVDLKWKPGTGKMSKVHVATLTVEQDAMLPPGGATALRDAEWATWTCTRGWPVQGVWPARADGTDVNAGDVRRPAARVGRGPARGVPPAYRRSHPEKKHIFRSAMNFLSAPGPVPSRPERTTSTQNHPILSPRPI